MAKETIKYVLNGQLTDNMVTRDVKDDKILTLVAAGTADKQRVISEIMEMNPGLEREVVEAVVNLEQRVVTKLVLNGFSVNMGLYRAVAQFKGVVENRTWNPQKNEVYVLFTQGAALREAMRRTSVNIIGEKGSAMFIAGGMGAATRAGAEAHEFRAKAGRNFTLTGSKLKVAGDHPEVGITLTSSKGKVTKITPDMWAVNDPSKLIFLIPSGLSDGEYTLTVTTQYVNSGRVGRLLKTPRSVKQTIYLGEAPEHSPGGSPGGGSGEHGEAPDPAG